MGPSGNGRELQHLMFFYAGDAANIRAPGGRPAWMPAVFGADMDVRCENGDDTAYPMSGFDVTRKVLSFGYFSLHQQRKVTRRRRKLCF